MGNGMYSAPLCSPNAGWEMPRGECPRRCNACFQSRMPVPFRSCSLHRRLPALIITRKASSAISIYQAGRAVLEIPRFDAGTRGLIE